MFSLKYSQVEWLRLWWYIYLADLEARKSHSNGESFLAFLVIYENIQVLTVVAMLAPPPVAAENAPGAGIRNGIIPSF